MECDGRGDGCLMFNLRENIYISAWFVLNAPDLYLFSRVYPAAGRLWINPTGEHRFLS